MIASFNRVRLMNCFSTFDVPGAQDKQDPGCGQGVLQLRGPAGRHIQISSGPDPDSEHEG